MLFFLTLDHIGNAFLYLDLYGHGKLDLMFVHRGVGWSSKICPKKCTYLRPKLPRKIIEPRALEKNVCLFLDTFT